jgi:hypothetical protein
VWRPGRGKCEHGLAVEQVNVLAGGDLLHKSTQLGFGLADDVCPYDSDETRKRLGVNGEANAYRFLARRIRMGSFG